MASVKLELIKPYVDYGTPRKKGESILVDVSQVSKMVRQGYIEDPNSKKKKSGVRNES